MVAPTRRLPAIQPDLVPRHQAMNPSGLEALILDLRLVSTAWPISSYRTKCIEALIRTA
jgi:hypothetical protein